MSRSVFITLRTLLGQFRRNNTVMLLVFTQAQGSLIITSDVIDDIIINDVIDDISVCYYITSQTHFSYICSSVFSFIYCVQ